MGKGENAPKTGIDFIVALSNLLRNQGLQGVQISDIETDVTNLLALLTMGEKLVEFVGTVPLGDDFLFIINGGPVLCELVGVVTDDIGAGASACTISEDVTDPAGTVALSTAVDVAGSAIGTSIHFTAAVPSVLTPDAAGAVAGVPVYRWLCTIGVIKASFAAALAGEITWYLRYWPLSVNSTVTPYTP